MYLNTKYPLYCSGMDFVVIVPKIQVFLSACKHDVLFKCLKACFQCIVLQLCLLSCLNFFAIIRCEV